ncbi:hypothetical protein lbkm_0835 [Lachnospiraceae bacterium KM106-2]|nr:hypothetical protein lbkm_0835 [Lachnospiraceae bacterium KM106-2]
MDIKLKKVSVDEKEILRNLFEKYSYEFTQWDGREINPLGLYGYDYLDYYWSEPNRFAYFIQVDGNLAGFVMVNDIPKAPDTKTDFSIAEFFILYKYRQKGVGKTAANEIFSLHKGDWQLKRHPHNIASVYFWDHVVSEYTKGNYKVIKSCPGTAYHDGTLGDILFFHTC